MTEIIIILILLLALYLSIKYKKYNSFNNKKNKQNIKHNIKTDKNTEVIHEKIKSNDIKLINRKVGVSLRDNKYEYYTKKRVRFEDEPTYYDCPNDNKLNEQDKFIDEYVYNNKVFCKNKATKQPLPLAEYRRDIFEFRNKTNQIANNYSPIDRIDEMIVNNPDLSGMKISVVYDALTSNEFNTNHKSINMPETYEDGIAYVTNDNANSNFAGYKSSIY